MLSVFSQYVEDDADELERSWGIPIAIEMLRERVITARDFLELCQEAAGVARPRRVS